MPQRRKWGATDAALILAAAAVVPAWARWLNERHKQRKKIVREDGEEDFEVDFYQPSSALNLAQGFGSCFVYLAALDALICRKAVDQTSRFFILHTLANIGITVAAAPDAYRSMTRPFKEPFGKMSILPVYLIASLFTYHLSVFSNVPKDEWVHHILFGGGIGGVGLAFPASQIGNALAFFICGLPGGIDYGMLAAVKEGLLDSDREKLINTKLNVWCRSPGLSMVAYAIFLGWRHHKPAPIRGEAAALVAGLAFLNGQYYMQKVVANAAMKTADPTPGC